ncbi:histone deacetylase family protein [Curvivirga aplysinae]|uniref:histone deacetylase family protein n=1 Tax=Curvivirga aplysinae TaxID=2529852 RepID=UPI0012BC0CE9|nr:histone deacetylase family protein [Curvivirga aplysinae]MTI08824.1 histone deacetylase family protein [Curvivirga aplysinae]
MKIVLNEASVCHDAKEEFHHGKLVPSFENPSRLRKIISLFKENGVTEFLEPKDFGLDPIFQVHEDHYVTFLRDIWDEWKTAGNEGDVIPYIWPAKGLKHISSHENLNAKIGSYAFSSDSAIVDGTWKAAYQGAQTALTALDYVCAGDRSAFALTRPPGHHAHAATYGGYCYLNNAAIVAQAARDRDYDKVCVLDVDFHHGNGTQDIFYDREDVLTISIHGHPRTNFPYYLGYEDEMGEGVGAGCNLNLPLKDGADFKDWEDAFHIACDKVKEFGAEMLVVPLGVDTYEGDPISKFKLKTDDFLTMGKLIEALALPTVFTMEGGYDVGPIGQNVFNVLKGFDDSL